MNISTKKIRQVLTKPLFYTAESMLGLDIGSRFLKFVEIEETAGGYKLKKIGIKQLPLDVIVDEEIMDTDTLVNIITSFLQEFKIETKSVALMVSGRDVLVKTVETELKGKELLKKKEEVARANIPYDIEDVCFDVMSLKGSSNKVLVAAAKNDKIYSTLKIAQEIGLVPVVISPIPIVIEEVCRANELLPEKGVYIVVSISDDETNVILVRDSILEKYIDIGRGVDIYLKDIAREHAIPVDEAVPLLFGKEAVSKKVAKIIDTNNSNVVQQVTGFLKGEDMKCEGGVLTGEGAAISGLKDAFESTVGVECKVGNPFGCISIEETVELPSRFDIAMGLAITGLKKTGVNLLPLEMRPKVEKEIVKTLKEGFPLLTGVIAIVVCLLIYIAAGFNISNRKVAIETLKAQEKTVMKRIAMLEDLKRKRTGVTKRTQIIQDLEKGKYSRVKFLNEINRILPPYTWLTILKEEAGGEKSFSVLIKGVTESNLAVSKFLERLEDSPHFSGVELSYTQLSNIEGVEVTEFEIKANFMEH